MKRKAFLPPSYFLASIVAMIALHFLLPLRRLVPSPWNYLGVVGLAVGIALNIWASRLFDNAQTTVKPFERSACLVTRGPYRFSRHPMYLGMALALLGLAVILGTATPTIIMPAFVLAMSRKFIPVEEKDLQEALGKEWREYARRVRCWI
ncbi:MAG: isoprenylcysteine carboxylmethyltransferase family protein [Planctomycetes bacterium]|nr:isoprenylcysteine carboxylmethyltransferase family protein [Planctomycetota bacterium]